MPAQSERGLTKAIRQWLVSENFIVIKLTTYRSYGTAGWPDLMVLDRNGRSPLFLEVKTATGKITLLQRQRIQCLSLRAYYVAVVRSVQEVKDEVAKWLKN